MARVVVRPAQRGDAEALIRANRDSRALHHPWAEPFTDMEGFEAWLAEAASGASVALIARERATDEVVGALTLSQIARKGFQSACLGFYGSSRCAGRGLMTEAVTLTAAYAFDVLGLHRLEANIQPANLRSLAVARRAGFRREGFSPRYLKVGGVWRDHERWARLADDPMP